LISVTIIFVPICIDTCNKKHIAILNSIAHRSQHNYSFPSGRLQAELLRYDTCQSL